MGHQGIKRRKVEGIDKGIKYGGGGNFSRRRKGWEMAEQLCLQFHCVFCLRRTGVGEESTEVDLEEVSQAELTSLVTSVEFLSTLNWTWWALGRKEVEEEFLDFGGVLNTGGQEQAPRRKFKTVPNMCQDCADKVLGVHTLLEKVSKELLGLKKAVLETAKETVAKRQALEQSETELSTDGKPAEKTEIPVCTEEILPVLAESEEMITFCNPDDIKIEAEDDLSPGSDTNGDNDEVDAEFCVKREQEPLLRRSSRRKPPSRLTSGDKVKTEVTEKKKAKTVSRTAKIVKPKNPRKYRCYKCGIHFLEKKPWRVHRRQHFLGLKRPQHLKCELCQNDIQRPDIVEHLKGHVGNDYVLRCPNPECLFAFVTYSGLDKHLTSGLICREKGSVDNMEAYRRNLLSCSECGFEFEGNLRKTQGLRTHLTNFHETAVKNYNCPVSGCQKQFSVRQSVQLHLTQHDFRKEKDSQPCSYGKCNEKLVKFEEMAAHLAEVHEAQEIIKCAQCPFLFLSREQLVPHMYQHRYSELPCDICGLKFGKHYQLAEHYFKVHQIGHQYQCEHCPKAYLDRKTLNLHINQGHGNTSKEKSKSTKASFQCEDCGHVAKSQDGFRNHQIINHGAEPYGCTMCPETFTVKQYLHVHVNVVHMGKTITCQEPNCALTFKNQRQLRQHRVSVHEGKTFPCDLCGKAFGTQHHVKRHVKFVHLEVRDYKCDLCEEAFKDSSTLKKHRLIHTGERPFACEICGQPFRDIGVLSRHLLSHQEKGADFKPKGPRMQARKRVKVERRSVPVKSETNQGNSEVGENTVECNETSLSDLNNKNI